ncbi:hypothetical protein M1446_01605 [Candidatus Dependentiae bacterium]|nr:hypothetical protein [Candidatus Dependentiae bacterium]
MALGLLVQSWYENLQFFQLKNLKLFGLITLKAFFESYKTVFKNLWILIIWIGAVYSAKLWDGVFSKYLNYFIIYFWIFFLALSLRSSINIKDHNYFFKYFLRFGLQFIVLAILNYYLDYQFFLLAFFIIWLNFIFDDYINLKNIYQSFLRSIKLILFNFPLILIISAILGSIKILTFYSISKLPIWFIYKLDIINYVITLPVFLAIIINFYIKRVHEQFLIYYK